MWSPELFMLIDMFSSGLLRRKGGYGIRPYFSQRRSLAVFIIPLNYNENKPPGFITGRFAFINY